MTDHFNAEVAGRLEEVAALLAAQGAGRFRVRAYEGAASTLRHESQSVAEIFRQNDLRGLEALPNVGLSIARSIRDLLENGRLPMLERLCGDTDPTRLLASVPGIGRTLADRLYHDLGIDSLAEREAAAHDGRLSHALGFGAKRLAGARDSRAHRLQRVRPPGLNTDAPRPWSTCSTSTASTARERRPDRYRRPRRVASTHRVSLGCLSCTPSEGVATTRRSFRTPHSPTACAAPTTGW